MQVDLMNTYPLLLNFKLNFFKYVESIHASIQFVTFDLAAPGGDRQQTASIHLWQASLKHKYTNRSTAICCFTFEFVFIL